MSQTHYEAPLAPRTTFQIGGPAERLVIAETEEEVRLALTENAVTVLGGGSNVLIADGGLRGTVLAPALRGITFSTQREDVRVYAAAGELWDDLVAAVVAEGLAGVECLSGIPGWVGAVPIQNVGAYGQEVADTIVSVRLINRATGEIVERDREACAFAYRESVFKHAEADRWVVVGVTFLLRKGPAKPLRYGELVNALGPGDHDVDTVRTRVLALRRAKGMVLSPDDPDTASAGSFFTNPLVPLGNLDAIKTRAQGIAPGVTMPTFEGGPGMVKLAAGWLIEQAGFRKGEARGRAALSSKHALALVNRGGASAAEIVSYAREIEARVLATFGVRLEPEPVFLGF